MFKSPFLFSFLVGESFRLRKARELRVGEESIVPAQIEDMERRILAVLQHVGVSRVGHVRTK